jgi:hypothetical protein
MAINAGGVIRGAKSLAMGLKSTYTGSSSTSAAKSIITKTASTSTALKAGSVGGGVVGAATSILAVPLIKTAVSSMGIGNTYSYVDEKLGGYLPGGISPSQDNVMDIHGGLARKPWNTGTTTFGILRDGNWYAMKKNGQLKIFKPYKSIVFGKKIEPRKFIRLAQKYHSIQKDLNSVFKSIKTKRRH